MYIAFMEFLFAKSQKYRCVESDKNVPRKQGINV
jgi:hypothetical protein